MSERRPHASTRNSTVIKATPDALYRAFTDPDALAVWMAPGDMTARVQRFDGRVGGGYEMSLSYPSSDATARGKTSDREDRYVARFVDLTPPRRLITAITFETDDPAFAGEMIMEATFEADDAGTRVTLVFTDLPPGIRPEDNEMGTRLSLEKLACYVEHA